jgi:hypothetical protein
MFRTIAMCPAADAIAAPVLAISASAQGITGCKQGNCGSAVKGAAGTNGSTGDKSRALRQAHGAVAVVEPQSEYMMALSRHKLQSPLGLNRR